LKNRRQNGRHELKKAREARNAFIIIALVLVAMIIGAVYVGQRPKALPSQGIAAKYTLKKMQEVWTNDFQGVLDGLFQNRYRLPKIQERFNSQSQLIRERFHTNISTHLVTTYNAESLDVLAGCWLTNGQPQVDFVVPKLLDVYYEARDSGETNWLLKMQDGVVLSMMHELDHLALGLVAGDRKHPSSVDKLADYESRTWANTCEYVIRPMVEEYGVSITSSDRIYYGKWIEAGRNEKSPLWRDFIRSLYKKTRQ